MCNWLWVGLEPLGHFKERAKLRELRVSQYLEVMIVLRTIEGTKVAYSGVRFLMCPGIFTVMFNIGETRAVIFIEAERRKNIS